MCIHFKGEEEQPAPTADQLAEQLAWAAKLLESLTAEMQAHLDLDKYRAAGRTYLITEGLLRFIREEQAKLTGGQ